MNYGIRTEAEINRILQLLDSRYPRIPTIARGTITKVPKDSRGVTQEGAEATINGEVAVPFDLPWGVGSQISANEDWVFETTDGPLGQRWKAVRRVRTPNENFGDVPDAVLPTIEIPGATSGGIYTESAQATMQGGNYNKNASPDPTGGAPAAAYLYPLAFRLGGYDLWGWPIRQLAIQVRETGIDEWDQLPTVNLKPSAPARILLGGTITDTQTSIAVTIPIDASTTLIVDTPVYWVIGGEMVLGILTYSTSTLTIVAHDGVTPDPQFGNGFVASSAGRGQFGTQAAAHLAGAEIMLASTQVVLPVLRPNVAYQVQIAAINSQNRQGPWSDTVSFTTWKQNRPPAAPTGLTVDHRSASIFARWSRVTTDVDGNIRGDKMRYAVFRHTAALAVGLTIAQVLSAGATEIGREIAAVTATIPATQGNGNYVGVAAVATDGLISQWTWGQDSTPPPQPDPQNWTVGVVPGAIQFQYHPTLNLVDGGSHTDTCHNYAGVGVAYNLLDDEGYAGWKLYYSAASNGSSPQYIGSFGPQSSGAIPAAAMAGYYKLVPMDWSGNSPTLGSTEWKFAPILFPTNDEPLNGNFQIPRPDIAFPAYWEVASNTFTQPGSSITYDTSGGLVGNRVLKIVMASGETGSVTIEQTVTGKMFPLNGDSSWSSGEIWSLAGLEFWHREGSVSDKFIIDIDLELYSDDEGTTSIGGLGGGPSQHFYTYDPGIGDQWGQVASTDWQEGHILAAGGVTTAALPKVGGKPTSRRYKMTIAFWPGDTAAKTLYFDDIRLVQLFGTPNPPDDWMLPSLL